MPAQLKEAMAALQEQEALTLADRLLADGCDPQLVVGAGREAMELMGERFARGEAFIPELIMAAEIMRSITAKVKPYLAAAAPVDKVGTVLLATVQGDIHDIGKDIVAMMLDIAGFEVIDLGVDVPPALVSEKVGELHPDVVGLSGLLTVAFESMRATVAAIEGAGLRSGVKIMLGGAPVNEDVRVYAAADAVGKDAVAAVALARSWMEAE